MPHFPKPFFRASRGLWYVQIAGKQHNLGPDEDAAFRTYHGLMAKPREKAVVGTQSLVAVVDAFLDYVQHHCAPATYRWYKDNLERFCNFIPRSLLLSDLKPYHVQQWIDSYPDLSSGTKRNYCRSIQRAMRWAEEQAYVERSPLAHFRKPAAGNRELVVSKTHFAQLLKHTKDQAFKDLLMVTWETGCRPQESLRVEARHVDPDKNRWIFPASEAKGGKSPRVVYLTPKAIEITLRLAAKHPVGTLFRNTDGAPWTPDACNCRFATLKKKLKVRYCLYALRHTWMNRMLMGGVVAVSPSDSVAARPPLLARRRATSDRQASPPPSLRVAQRVAVRSGNVRPTTADRGSDEIEELFYRLVARVVISLVTRHAV